MQRIPEFFFLLQTAVLCTDRGKTGRALFSVFKGTQYNEIFGSCFFIKRLILIPTHMPRNDIEFRRIFVDLFVLGIQKNRLPLMITKRYIINTLNVE
jgi:hypothetical protein